MGRSVYHILLLRFLILIGIFQLERLLFFFFNFTYFTSETSLDQLLLAFIHGFRFDIALLGAANILLLLLSLLPYPWLEREGYQKFLSWPFWIVNIPLILFNLIDLNYFLFTGKRTGAELLAIRNDAGDQLLQLMLHYAHLILLGGLLVFLFIRIKLPVKNLSKWNWWQHILLSALLMGATVLAIRGGTQYKPLKPDHAFVHTPNKLGHLVLNTPYNFFSTLAFPRIPDYNFYSEEELKAGLRKYAQKDSVAYPKRKLNVVLIILESFAAEYSGLYGMGRTYFPFYDSLARKGTFFPHHFANGRRSIEAVPSLLVSIPSLMPEPYITSLYQSNEIHGLPELLYKEGYRTMFFHGGKNGTMGFDKFAENAGVQDYYGLDEYPDTKKDFDGNWGIYDEPFLRWTNKKLSKTKEPFFATVFTLSSHQPYSIPPALKNKFPKGKLEIHESIGYADYSLRKFFEAASKEDWYENTLFILTADHTQDMEVPEHKNVLDEYHVPLVFFKPGETLYADTSRVSHHSDIPNSIADLLGLKPTYTLPFGQSLFQPGKGRALHFSDGDFRLFHQNNYLVFNPEKPAKLYSIKDHLQQNELTDTLLMKEYEKEIKYFIQFYNNGLNNNSWYR